MNLGEFFSMGGRGFYVWGSYGAFAIAIVVEVILLRHRARRINEELKQELLATNAGSNQR
jgi:heme exporter protein D